MIRNLKNIDLMGIFNKVSVFAFVAAAVIFGHNFLFLNLPFVEAFKPVYFVALGFAVVTSLMFVSWSLVNVFRASNIEDKFLSLGLASFSLISIVLIVFNIAPVAGLILFTIIFFIVFMFGYFVAAFFRAFM